MFVLGLESNKKWLHGIRQDKRADYLKQPEEYSFNGERISLTFRHISTFLSVDETRIYGQGATSKSKDDPRPVINGDTPEAQKLLEAFGTENQQSDFDWDATYGAGSDVLHLKEQLPKLFSVDNDTDCWRVRLCLYEKGIKFSSHELNAEDDETTAPSFLTLNPRGTTPVFIDVDKEKTTVYESLAILQYLEMFYPSKQEDKYLLPSLTDERSAFARVLQRMQESEHLSAILQSPTPDLEAIEYELSIWNTYILKAGGHVATRDISLADIAAYPVIADFTQRTPWNMAHWPEVEAWLTNMECRESVRACLPASTLDVT
jgi:glutathione S-transferase